MLFPGLSETLLIKQLGHWKFRVSSVLVSVKREKEIIYFLGIERLLRKIQE